MATDISKALAPDAPVVMNENGGKQSDTPYGFHLLPASSIFAAAEVAAYGAKKYGESFGNRNYTKIPATDHVNHALQHLYGYLAGDTSDDHLAHAIVRCLFAYDVDQNEEKEETAEESIFDSCGTSSCGCCDNWVVCDKARVIYDVWAAIRSYHHCLGEDPDGLAECWFAMDTAYRAIAYGMFTYTKTRDVPNPDVSFELVLKAFESFYETLDKDSLVYSELKAPIETFVDQLAEEFVARFGKKCEEKDVDGNDD